MSNPLKKTMVFLGLAEEDLEEHPVSGRASAEEEQSGQQSAARTAAPKATVTPLRKVTPVRPAASQSMSEILTVHPVQYSEATTVAENFREGVPVIINLSRMQDGDAKRLIDFASGLVLGLHGRIERVTSKVFLLTPEHIAVSGDETSGEAESGSFFVSRTE